MDKVIKDREHLASLAYSNCNTRIISLKELDLPETASVEEYRQIYHNSTTAPNRSQNAVLLRDAIESIRYGISPPVAFPTETVYGLGADATNEPAIAGIFAAKGRPSDNPLIVHVASVSHLERLTGSPLPEIYRSLAERFWPGPLTILLPVPRNGSSVFAKNVHPGQNTIGFRIPSSRYARFFIAAADRPIAGPSANSSGKPSPTTAQHVLDDLRGKINFILDGGPCDVGVESTVVDGLHDPPLILRPGGVSLAELRAHGREFGNRFADTAIGYKRQHHATTSGINGNEYSSPSTTSTTPSRASSTPTQPSLPNYEEDITGAPRAPGMKYRHYAPKGKLILFSDTAVQNGRVQSKLDDLLRVCSLSADGTTDTSTPPPPELRIGIISCRWPSFAGLPVSVSIPGDSDASEGPNIPEALSTSKYREITTVATATPDSLVSTSASTSTASTSTAPSTAPGSTSKSKNPARITLFNVQIGASTTTLAHNLFGVLRLFDELDCAFIFAETVPRSAESGDFNDPQATTTTTEEDLEDAVIDRIEKAAAEKVD